ncbi:phage tail protein, partial [Lysinibacillus sp. RC79]|uniref:phage tail protein n=1 Tax=Lysinibacillus sp. RC79 TaxID=3156296 RepID=UPI0035192B71
MIYVTRGNEVEPLVQVSNFELTQEVKGDFNITLTSHNTNNNPAHRLLQEESIITVGDFDYRIKQMKETRHGKQIVAVNTFYDLVDKRQNEIYGGTRTFNEFANFVLKNTGWTFTSSVSGSQFIENFGENNAIALLQALCQVYECEYVIMPNNRIHFSNQIGGDRDAQYRYGHNVKALSKNVDTTGLKTYIEGYGAASEGGGQLFVSYESPYAQKYGKREAEPVHDDRFTNANSLLEHIKSELIDYPEVTFELDSIELLDKELGERVWLIYEPLEMEFQTRILSQTKQFVNGELRTTKVVLGNTLPKTTTDILISQKVEIDENKKITRSKFEQTNDRITMEVETIGESISKLELTDKEIKLSVDETNKSLAEFKITSQQISTRIENKVDNL